jgi:hypothetical protein
MFRLCGEALAIVGRVRLMQTEWGFVGHRLSVPPRHGSDVSPRGVIGSLKPLRPREPNMAH